MEVSSEVQKIIERYSKRTEIEKRYSPFFPAIYLTEQEKERYLIECLKQTGLLPLQDRKILEIGAGNGNQILFLLKLGAKPENILVNELLPDRIEGLKTKLPATIQIIEGNALDLDIPLESIDIIIQSMVFTSILDIDFKKALAAKLWSFIQKGGGLIWYDFTFDNPKNPDVKGINYKQIVELFPNGHIHKWRLTLAPPLARSLSNMIFMYKFLNLFPFLKTHLLCWIRKK